MDRRLFLKRLAAATAVLGGASFVDPEFLVWVPGAKTIFLPPAKPVIAATPIVQATVQDFQEIDRLAKLSIASRRGRRYIEHVDAAAFVTTVNEGAAKDALFKRGFVDANYVVTNQGRTVSTRSFEELMRTTGDIATRIYAHKEK